MAVDPIITVDRVLRAVAETTTGAIKRMEKGLFSPPVKKAERLIETSQIKS